MKYQFIITYNVYKKGKIIGSGLITRMSETFYLSKDISNEIAETLKEDVGKEYYYADQIVTVMKE